MKVQSHSEAHEEHGGGVDRFAHVTVSSSRNKQLIQIIINMSSPQARFLRKQLGHETILKNYHNCFSK